MNDGKKVDEHSQQEACWLEDGQEIDDIAERIVVGVVAVPVVGATVLQNAGVVTMLPVGWKRHILLLSVLLSGQIYYDPGEVSSFLSSIITW